MTQKRRHSPRRGPRRRDPEVLRLRRMYNAYVLTGDYHKKRAAALRAAPLEAPLHDAAACEWQTRAEQVRQELDAYLHRRNGHRP